MKEVINNLEEQMTDAWSEDSVDGCILVAEQYAIEKQIEMLEELRDLEVVNFDTYNIFKKDLQQQLQKLKDGK